MNYIENIEQLVTSAMNTMGRCTYLLLFMIVGNLAVRVPFNDELLLHTRVTVSPIKEKVVEDSAAMFICHVSSLEPNVDVTWKHNGKPLQLKYDAITVATREEEHSHDENSNIHNSVSVLRIQNATKHRHKGKYACVATSSDADTASASATLLVVKDRGSYGLEFGQLPPRHTIVVDPEIPVKYRASVEMTCTAYHNDIEVKNGIFWMKNSTYEVFETHAFQTERIFVGIRGSMQIRQPEPSDSGVYECVAQMNKKVIISHKVNLIVKEREIRTNCTDQDGTVVALGAEYHPYTSDACTVCMCEADPYMMACSNEACEQPTCSNYVVTNGTCCEYRCLGDEYMGQTGCRDRSGETVDVGEHYHPYDNDPCTVCECQADPNMMSCSNEACDVKPACENYRTRAGTCCEYVCIKDIALDVRQVGPDAAMVQWESPNDSLKNVTIAYADSSTVENWKSFKTINVTNGNNYAMLQGLVPNIKYDVYMTGTSSDDDGFSGNAELSLDLRRGGSLKLTPDDHPEITVLRFGKQDGLAFAEGPVTQVTYINLNNYDYVLVGELPCDENKVTVCQALTFHRHAFDNIHPDQPLLALRFNRTTDFNWVRAHL